MIHWQQIVLKFIEMIFKLRNINRLVIIIHELESWPVQRTGKYNNFIVIVALQNKTSPIEKY